MAQSLPESTFVGIDLSPRQIAEGEHIATALGLTNLDLTAQSILDFDAGWGEFDYIVCHGVYSWVPPSVQDKILRVCKDHLAANGVAYVSYNTYPGWRMKQLLRDLLRFHSCHESEPAGRVERSRAVMGLLAAAVDGSTDLYGKLLKEQVNLLATQPDYYLYHEHLEEVNDPVYFHDFAARSAAVGLQYVDEAEPAPIPTNLAGAIRAFAQNSANIIEREQRTDFLCGRTFRKTLLCHDDVVLRRPPSADAIRSLSLTTDAQPVSENPNLTSTAAEEFRMRDGRSVTTTDPAIKTALASLSAARPLAVHFDDLWERVSTALNRAGIGPTNQVRESGRLAAALLQVYQAGLVLLHARNRQWTRANSAQEIVAARVLPQTGDFAAD
jgi:SAM-dependent methyltransferase